MSGSVITVRVDECFFWVDCEFCAGVADRECYAARGGVWFACGANESKGYGRRTGMSLLLSFPSPGNSLTRAATGTQARKQREAEEASLAQAQAAKLLHEREEQFKEDALRQLRAREQQYARLSPTLYGSGYQSPYESPSPYQKRRARAGSEATAIPDSGLGPGGDWESEHEYHERGGGSGSGSGSEGVVYQDTITMTETFPVDVEVGGVSFNTVRLFHPRRGKFSGFGLFFSFRFLTVVSVEGLGTVYLADPVCDDVNATLQLELYVITFYSKYYSTSQGSPPLSDIRHGKKKN